MDRRKIARKATLVETLELVCQELEPTPIEYEDVNTSYAAVGEWLEDGDKIAAFKLRIYPQGSIALETATRRFGRNEFDLDFVCFLAAGSEGLDQGTVYDLIGERLREHGTYKEMCEPKNRCWRLNYASRFHMDMTPAVPNWRCTEGGVLVPDRALTRWKPTNPEGYLKWFKERASLVPKTSELVLFNEKRAVSAKAEPLPEQRFSKGVLRRAVQIMKRHRDIHFAKRDHAPISIIITTLAARAYAHVVASNTYDSEFDLLLDVLEYMPIFIDRVEHAAGVCYTIPNPTTQGENFAEKWNQQPALAQAFYSWLDLAKANLRRLEEQSRADALQQFLGQAVGVDETRRVFAKQAAAVNGARQDGTLYMDRNLGITVAGTLPIPRNTFYGE